MDIAALFAQLGSAVEGAPGIALGAAFVWGLLSIILSPCHLASIPLIVAFVGQRGQTSTRDAFWLSALFATGILITIAAIGMVTAALGRMLGDVGGWANYIVAAIFLVIGLHLLGSTFTKRHHVRHRIHFSHVSHTGLPQHPAHHTMIAADADRLGELPFDQ